MKRKILPAAVALLFVFLLALSGCGLLTGASDERFPSDVADGQDYAGSPESFLASQETPTTIYRRMYEEAREKDGYTGTYLEFLREIGLENENGAGVQKALRSVVSVECAYTVNTGTVYSRGSGIIYSLDKTTGDALIVTNYHVVYTTQGSGREHIPYISDDITLWLYGGEVETRGIPATYLGGVMDYDIAVLKVQGSNLLKETKSNPVYACEAVACDSDSVTVGENVYAIGNAAWRGMTVTDGIVSKSVDEIYVKAANDQKTLSLPEIRTTAPINQGNSGGGLFNESGELVGIVNARTETDGIDGMGYAIPANIALSVAQNVIDNAQEHGASVARLGIDIKSSDSHAVYDEETAKYYVEEKILVTQVTRDRAAYRAGIKAGDTLYSVKLRSTRNGAAYSREIVLRNASQLTCILYDVRLGDTLEITVLRSGEQVTLTAKFSSSGDFTLYD